MIVRVRRDKRELGAAAAEQAASAILNAIRERGSARMLVATGASQFEFLEALTGRTDIEWRHIELFQLDEYIGLNASHPASFTRYITERLAAKTGVRQYHSLNGGADPAAVLREAGNAIAAALVDVAFVGIGENGHLAFNDPPADFATDEPYIIVNLDESCRRQQVGEGWFADLAAVPKQAISMSVRQISRAREIVCLVPDQRKAAAVRACLEGPITPLAPASILRTHPNVTIYLDHDSASLLKGATLAKFSTNSQREVYDSRAESVVG